ncbi:MAG: FkbM family methyltransferase [Methylovulum sp.]|nr:FkbM family methyltransferase [Methylovulum sp.]
MPRPHYKISYAQNREDLILAGILRDVSLGFYVDVGANHHELDSVTKIFYDKGWNGINVEPNKSLYAELCVQRPRDICVNSGLSSQTGSLLFRQYDSFDGLSTFSSETKSYYTDKSYKEESIDVLSLADLLHEHRPSGDINFLKIDVEGMELEVLLGGEWNIFRPWVLCIERTQNIARQKTIITFLESVNYTNCFYDGINDYFVANEKYDIWKYFSFARDVLMDGVPVNYIFIKYIEELKG